MSGSPEHAPTEQDRGLVTTMVAYGIPQREVAAVVGVSINTLRKHYKNEIDTAGARATTRIAETLYRRALDGSIRACTFWLERRGGDTWKLKQTVEHEGKFIFGGKFTLNLGGEDEKPNRIMINDNTD